MFRLVALCPLLFAFATLTACSGDRAGTAGAFRGAALPAVIHKPTFTLTDFNGRPFDFATETRDKVALLFFGYTHCPDVCPLHMANIAAVLRRMSAEDQARVVTVFVTTDPERDTPTRLREWLGNFDPRFVGLTGSHEELASAMESLALTRAAREFVGADSSNYFVDHGAQVFAFARDGFAYLIYPFGIRQEDWANDLPLLIRDQTGAEIRRALAAQFRAGTLNMAPDPSSVPAKGLVVSTAVVAQPTSQDEAAAYLTLRNGTVQEDTLVAIAADLAGRAEIHQTMGEGDLRHMMSTPTVVIPAQAETRLAPNEKHIMLFQLRRKLAAGDTVTLYLSLARAGAVEVRAPVVPYAELERALGLSGTARE